MENTLKASTSLAFYGLFIRIGDTVVHDVKVKLDFTINYATQSTSALGFIQDSTSTLYNVIVQYYLKINSG